MRYWLTILTIISLGIFTLALPTVAQAWTPTTRGLHQEEAPRALSVYKGRSQVLEFKQAIKRVAIGNPEVAEVVPLQSNQLLVNGKVNGTTTLAIWSQQGHEVLFKLSVVSDYAKLTKTIQQLIPNEKNYSLNITDDSFIISGALSSSTQMNEIKKLAATYGYQEDAFVDLTETPTPQVALDVKIAEATRTSLKDFKVGLASNINGDVGFTTIDSLPANTDTPVVIGALSPGQTSNVGGLVAATTIGGSDLSFQARFDLLEQEGKVRILAEPTLVCTNDKEASFLAGGEFPFIVGVDQNGNLIVEFKEFGIRLNFTPHVFLRSGRIQLKVEPEVSQLDTSTSQTVSGGQSVFGLLSRRTETTVELKDGSSLMISGLISRNEQETISKTPWAGDLPVIGALFRSKDNQKEDRELIVIVTPRILSPDNEPPILGAQAL